MNVVYRPSGGDSTEPDGATPRVALYSSGIEPSILDGQEAACRRYLATHQPLWRVVAVYRDEAPTGGWRAIRPSLRHLLEAAASGAFDLLLVHQLDRLSRRMERVEQVIEELDAASVALRTVREPFDSAAPTNRLILRLWAAFAEYERQVDLERRHERRLAAQRRRASAAKPEPSSAPPQPSGTGATAVLGTPPRQLPAGPTPEASTSRPIDRAADTKGQPG
jgi:DNA invertase Pin-like site-specific DNA recombinase